MLKTLLYIRIKILMPFHLAQNSEKMIIITQESAEIRIRRTFIAPCFKLWKREHSDQCHHQTILIFSIDL